MSARERTKGRTGQLRVKHLLLDRDWNVAGMEAGTRGEDILAIDPDGDAWSVEVKNCAGILPAHRAQAIRQAKARKTRWMLASHIAHTSSWLIQRQGLPPVIWNEKETCRNEEI